jgi:hypothetical protein
VLAGGADAHVIAARPTQIEDEGGELDGLRASAQDEEKLLHLMAAEAGKALAMAGSAGCLVQIEFAGSVAVKEVGAVIVGFQFQTRAVAIGTAKGVIDFIVADEAIFHMREVGLGGSAGGRLQTAMAGLARILRIQVSAELRNIDLVRRGEIFLRVNRRTDQRGDIAELEVERVIEILEHFSFALVAEGGGILLRRMTSEALETTRECLLVGESGLCGKTQRRQGEEA